MDSRDFLTGAPEDLFAREAAQARRRELLYAEDLAVILGSEAGCRVLYHWLDRARTFAPVSLGGEATIRAAALSDYGKARLAEIQAARPEAFFAIMTRGIKEGGDGEGEQ